MDGQRGRRRSCRRTGVEMRKRNYLSPNVTHGYIFQSTEDPHDLTLVWESADITNMFLSGNKCLMSVDYDTVTREIVEVYDSVYFIGKGGNEQ